MKIKIKEKRKAIIFRKKGYSIKEIAQKLNVAKSSVSVWVRDVKLSLVAEKRLLTKIQLGQFIAARNKRARTKAIEDNYLKIATAEIRKLDFDKNYPKLLCAIMYWCEGIKDVKHGISFINSDPNVIKSFLKLFRASFAIDEKRLKPQLHLHSYHNIRKEIDFWSQITNIKSSQFLRPYIKPNTGKRIRHNYRGCLSLRYYNADIARQLLASGRAFLMI